MSKTLFKKQFKLWIDIESLTLRTWEVDFSGCFKARASFNFGTKLTITKIESVRSCSANRLCCRTKQHQNDIPAKLLKQYSFFSNSFHKNVNQCIKNSVSVWSKCSRCNHLLQKKVKTSKDNYRPINILPNIL